jgi:hypothetical protein
MLTKQVLWLEPHLRFSFFLKGNLGSALPSGSLVRFCVGWDAIPLTLCYAYHSKLYGGRDWSSMGRRWKHARNNIYFNMNKVRELPGCKGPDAVNSPLTGQLISQRSAILGIQHWCLEGWTFRGDHSYISLVRVHAKAPPLPPVAFILATMITPFTGPTCF